MNENTEMSQTVSQKLIPLAELIELSSAPSINFNRKTVVELWRKCSDSVIEEINRQLVLKKMSLKAAVYNCCQAGFTEKFDITIPWKAFFETLPFSEELLKIVEDENAYILIRCFFLQEMVNLLLDSGYRVDFSSQDSWYATIRIEFSYQDLIRSLRTLL